MGPRVWKTDFPVRLGFPLAFWGEEEFHVGVRTEVGVPIIHPNLGVLNRTWQIERPSQTEGLSSRPALFQVLPDKSVEESTLSEPSRMKREQTFAFRPF